MTIGMILLAMLIAFGLIFSHKVAFHYGRLLGIRQLWAELNTELRQKEEKIKQTEPEPTIYEHKP